MAQTDINVIKGFIKDYEGKTLLPITRAELVLDQYGKPALHSEEFLAKVPDASIPGDKGLPGLMTAAEKVLLGTLNGGSGSGTGAIADIYTQLNNLFNIELKFNDTSIKFYHEKESTPINIKSGEGIAITSENNNVNIGLQSLEGKTTNTAVSSIVNNIVVDKYGRVTVVSGTDTLTGVKSSDITAESDEKSIANKKYVDALFNNANNIATGALKYAGVIQDEASLEDLYKENNLINKVNNYYKLTFSGSLPKDIVHNSVADQPFKSGDTLIVYSENNEVKFTYIPSGDEPITTLTVKDHEGTEVINNKAGNIELNFTGAINVSSTENSTTKATIEVPILSTTNSDTVQVGALTRTDYDAFKQASAKSMSYEGIVTGDMQGAYEIGQIVLGDSGGVSIYGLNDTYQLQVKQNEINNIKDSINPFISLTSFNSDVSKIQIIGENGIIAASENTTEGNVSPIIKLGLQYKETYLKLDETGKLDVKIGSYVEGVKTDGLVDYDTFISYTSTLYQDSVKFEAIENSLKGTAEGDEYRYGNDVLIKAIGGKRSNGSADWDILVI